MLIFPALYFFHTLDFEIQSKQMFDARKYMLYNAENNTKSRLWDYGKTNGYSTKSL
jgi:hypothetical protein